MCYQSEPDYNAETCKLVTASWFSSAFHASDPVSIGWPWWANNSCPPIYPNGTSATGDPDAGEKGCSLGSYPAYAVNATSAEDVVEAVKFAKKWGIRLNIKSTGHSFQGRSTAFGSLSVWTHYMRGIQYHSGFQPEKCPSNGTNNTQQSFTIAAGERDREVYEAAATHNLVVVGGSAQDVGIVGWFTGGGHGPLSSTYGMGVDNVLQVKIVTPDGELRVANACQNPDLFWAIRGGGGGTFGVVTEVTMKAYPSPQTSRHLFSLSLLDKNETSFFDLLAFVFGELPRLKEGGMQGYSVLLPPFPGISAYGAGSAEYWTYFWSFDVHDKPNGTIEELISPITERLDPLNGSSILYTSAIQSERDFFTMWNSSIGDEPVAVGGAALGSRLITAEGLTKDPQYLARVLQNISAPAEGSAPPVLQPYMIANNNSEAEAEVSATPAWRDAVLHFIVSEGFNDSDTFQEAKPIIDRVTFQRTAALKSLSPESGAYLNEVREFRY